MYRVRTIGNGQE